MKLYEIPEKYEVLEKMYEEAIDDETGEIKELEFAQAQEYENILKELLSDKLDNMIKFIKNKELDINMIKEEEKRGYGEENGVVKGLYSFQYAEIRLQKSRKHIWHFVSEKI